MTMCFMQPNSVTFSRLPFWIFFSAISALRELAIEFWNNSVSYETFGQETM